MAAQGYKGEGDLRVQQGKRAVRVRSPYLIGSSSAHKAREQVSNGGRVEHLHLVNVGDGGWKANPACTGRRRCKGTCRLRLDINALPGFSTLS